MQSDPPQLIAEKERLRAQLKSQLLSTSASWFAVAQHELLKHLEPLVAAQPTQGPQAVLGWIPAFWGEPNLRSLEKNEVNFFCPRCSGGTDLEFFKMPTQLIQSKQAILEPDPLCSELLDANKFSSLLILIPGLGFDASGARLGRGKGYYDRFLQKMGSHPCLKIGVCWSFQLLDSIPVSALDQRMDIVISEQGPISVKR